MRLYGERVFRNTIYNTMNSRTETRDAILWDVDDNNRKCRVKIQGSDKLITAYYPINCRIRPEYLRPGNAVKLIHTGGSRGRLEILSDGALVPTPVAGGSGTAPPSAVADSVLNGLIIRATSRDSFNLVVSAGSFRLGGSIYSVSNSPVMGDGTLMGSSIYMGVGDTIVTLASSNSYFRYDNIVAGIDGVIDVVHGTDWTTPTAASYPATPANHIHLGYVLVPPNVSGIDQAWVYAQWIAPRLTGINCTCANSELSQGTIGNPGKTEMSTTINVRVVDQYGNLLNRGVGGTPYQITGSIIAGTGYMQYSGQSGSSLTLATTSGDITFTYRKLDYPNCTSALIQFSCSDLLAYVYQFITVLDEDDIGIPC